MHNILTLVFFSQQSLAANQIRARTAITTVAALHGLVLQTRCGESDLGAKCSRIDGTMIRYAVTSAAWQV